MLDFIRDILVSFRQASLERVRSPFLGAFVFSWLGFNWPMLAILFFSKREIEKRLVYIGDNFGIESFIIGPLCTSALIALLLPQINKLVTRIQDKPNTDTVEMSLESKIKIGKKQQEIAEIEARKKLAEKKEERNIEEGIQQIKKEHEKALRDINLARQQYKDISSKLTDAAKTIAESQSQLSVEKEARAKTEKELISVNERVKVATEKLISANNDNNKAKVEMEGLTREINNLKKQMEEVSSYNSHLLSELNFISEKVPQFVRLANIDGKMEIIFNRTNYDKVLEALNLNNINILTAVDDDFILPDGTKFGSQTIKERNYKSKKDSEYIKEDRNIIISHQRAKPRNEE
ncbi:hypothetical protein PNF55_001312 [Cronobacter sakazakii]|uniref:hypothetical protein n=1 Tax=Cronobacter sakazakii TaxID=28141 RepID=UPI000B3DB46E|nr:hypothetical protein [Cronobacter sakazakii]EKK3987989.1 hypothetical protein [Cronobacter sakazakii]EKK3995793.1 hypothetical protein [Cronobacter sakazakii]EKK4067519.1 hypothetical protein [Cronobacter sakazakii]ELY2475617.1 hypothetical protein [Cronobacter sakazakii]ELY2668214.1 hypothetical protein [Cronobacter sakazakii]